MKKKKKHYATEGLSFSKTREKLLFAHALCVPAKQFKIKGVKCSVFVGNKKEKKKKNINIIFCEKM